MIIGGTAEEFFDSMRDEIKSSVNAFMGTMGELERAAFANLPEFAQKIALFNSEFSYKKYRTALRNWILYGAGVPINITLLGESAVNRAREIEEVHWRLRGISRSVKVMSDAAESAISQNKMLSDERIPLSVRCDFMEKILLIDDDYINAKKRIDTAVNKLIACEISDALYEAG